MERSASPNCNDWNTYSLPVADLRQFQGRLGLPYDWGSLKKKLRVPREAVTVDALRASDRRKGLNIHGVCLHLVCMLEQSVICPISEVRTAIRYDG